MKQIMMMTTLVPVDPSAQPSNPNIPLAPQQQSQHSSTSAIDGTEISNAVSALIFRADMRVDEVQRLLRSSRVLTVDAKSTGGSEADILKDCQTKLLHLAQR